jgi:predicted polyphosphate/ATP-dependent NAD kinase
MLKIGLLVNPWAGIGGSVALKGSDGEDIRQQAMARGAHLRAEERARRAFSMLVDSPASFKVFCWGGPMGADALEGLGLDVEVCGEPAALPSSAGDTRDAARALGALELDVLVFAGGDGTARDILDAVGSKVTVLGIPAGVKMHSAVYAVSPEAAGELLKLLATAGLVNVQLREVRDIDEEAFRQGVVKARFYGELLAPEEGHFLQHTKVSGVESPELAAADIAAHIVEDMSDETLYLLGPGSTTAAVLAELGLEGTLLGVDVLRGGEVLLRDATEDQLLQALAEPAGPAEILVTAIGGQGHVFGRGNQQFSPDVIRTVGLGNIRIIAAKSKIKGLDGRPLLVDSNDPELDRALTGYRRVVTGYHDEILYPVASLP